VAEPKIRNREKRSNSWEHITGTLDNYSYDSFAVVEATQARDAIGVEELTSLDVVSWTEPGPP
jgi:hypothetical protein